MNRPVLVTWIPTRRCNLKCKECAVRDFPVERELTTNQLMESFLKTRDRLGDVFHVILGGEPLLLDLETLIPFWESEQFKYALCSNSFKLSHGRVNELISLGLSNWSVSINTLDLSRDSRAKSGFEAIDLFRPKVPDIHCTITISRSNIQEVIRLTEELNARGVWTEHTFIHWAKNEHYDFASKKIDKLALTEADKHLIQYIANELARMQRAGYFVHTSPNWFDTWGEYAIDTNWRCKQPWVLVIDADGSLKPCLHLHGNRTRRLNILDNSWDWNDFFHAWETDKREQCQGCYHDCAWQCHDLAEKGMSREKILDWFAHRR